MLISPGGSCIALQLQLCLVSSSLSNVEQFSFEYCPKSHKTSSLIYHRPLWEVGLSPHSCSQPLYFAHLCLLIVQFFLWEAGLFAPPLFSAFVPCFAFLCWELSSLPHPHSLRLFQHSTPHPLLVVNYNSLFLLFSFLQGDSICPGAALDLRGGWGVTYGACCLPVGSSDLCRELWNWLAGKNDIMLFSGPILTGTGFSTAGHR
jgi:hypothetical protein